MRPPKPHYPLNAKLILVAITLVLLLLFALRSNYSPSSSYTTLAPNKIDYSNDEVDNNKLIKTPCPISPCTKIPPSLSDALIHYSTSSITPQQTLNEISVTSKVLQMKSPCNFLVFGLGHDSLMWSALNYGGRTIFLEEDTSWINKIKELYPTLVSYHVEYDSKVNEADKLMEIGKRKECTLLLVSDVRNTKCELALKNLPNEVYETKWDLIMVDAPTGYYGEAPGRMTAIYTAGLIARLNQWGGETHVFVHDVNREVEDKFSKEFLCQGYMKKQEGRLRHFTIPSHKDDLDKPFCPN